MAAAGRTREQQAAIREDAAAVARGVDCVQVLGGGRGGWASVGRCLGEVLGGVVERLRKAGLEGKGHSVQFQS